MLLLDGKKLAGERENFLYQGIDAFQKKHKKSVCLAVVLVGDDPASHVYVKNKELACQRVGITSKRVSLEANASQDDVLRVVDNLNRDTDVHGILVQLPLPKHISSDIVLGQISPMKDVDGLTAENMGLLWCGRPRVTPCTPAGVMEILRSADIKIEGKHAAVIGRSNIVGKPMAQLLQMANATVTVVHTKTPNPRDILLWADIVVVAAGKPRAFGRDDFKKGAVVIDVGIHKENGKLCGDVRFEELAGHAHAVTPVPGGVGPMTINMLLFNTLTLANQ